jgi:hypothetical protein
MSQAMFPDEKYPWLTGKYGKSVRSSASIVATNTLAGILAAPVANMVRSVLHKNHPAIAGEPQPGLGVSFPKPNELAASIVKTFSTRAAKTWLTSALAPPSAPAATGPQSATVPTTPVADAAQGPMFLGHDVKEVAKETALFGVSLIISKVYDQTLGPLVQHGINTVMGKGDEPIKKPSPMTPGGLANALASSFVSSFLLRPVAWPQSAPPAPGPDGTVPAPPAPSFGSLISTAAVNGLITAAFDSVWSRGPGPALQDAVNSAAGLEVEPRTPATFPMERMARTMARSTASGATYYLADSMSRAGFAALGAQLGGGFGSLVAMAGPALLGLVAGTALDAAVGDAIGSVGGSIYSWISGKPKAEDRPPAPEAPAEGAPTGAPPAAGAPTAPASTPAAPAAPATAAPTPAAAGASAPATPPAVATAGMKKRSRRAVPAHRPQRAQRAA